MHSPSDSPMMLGITSPALSMTSDNSSISIDCPAALWFCNALNFAGALRPLGKTPETDIVVVPSLVVA